MSGHATSRMRPKGIALTLVLLGGLLVTTADPADGDPLPLDGTVNSAGTPLSGYDVTLYRTRPGSAPEVVATTTTDAAGEFGIEHDATADPDRIFYLVARSGDQTTEPDEVTLASVLGEVPGTAAVVNPRTTVATAYAMAQFLDNGLISGPSPGVPNGASMAANVADAVTGDIGETLATHPNGDQTSARRTFNSLANMVAACVDDSTNCDTLRSASTPTGGEVPGDSLQALRNVATNPAHNAADLFTLSQQPPTPYTPDRATEPDTWALALRFDGDGATLNGPGNFAMDHEGNMWAAVNYTWAPPGEQACGSDLVARFTPDGSYYPGSPYRGGGLSGAGYGIARDRYGDIWVSNFGFAATECEVQPPHDTLSQISVDEEFISPPGGWTPEGVDWPQGMDFDAEGNLWVANCNNASVTRVPSGDTTRARSITDIGVAKPFDVAFGSDGNTYVTGTESDNVAILSPEGTPTAASPLTGFKRPMGIVADSAGELWVANSGLVDLPCPVKNVNADPPPSLGHIDPDTGDVTTYSGGGLFIPWGISVDGNDNIWVSNFGGGRLSGFCGRDGSPHCPPGATRGSPLAPDPGFTFDGLRRATATATDTAGNIWVTNNWKEHPEKINPGGYQVVVFLGLAGPVDPPPAPEPRPPAPEPEPPAPAPSDTTIPGTAPSRQPAMLRFTG